MGDVTYGACCVDDYTARSLGCDFLIHYGHRFVWNLEIDLIFFQIVFWHVWFFFFSCLVPINITEGIAVQYVFVDIKFDLSHFIESVKLNFKQDQKLAMVIIIFKKLGYFEH